VLSIVRNGRLSETVLFSSFAHPLIKRLKQNAPEISAGLLLLPHRALTARPRVLKKKFNIDYVVVGGGSLRKSMVGNCHRQGLFVAEYTVNSDRRYARALRYGVDAVVTDNPSLILSLPKK
jgi:glycerophosphoryl diester phosphodiesterase